MIGVHKDVRGGFQERNGVKTEHSDVIKDMYKKIVTITRTARVQKDSKFCKGYTKNLLLSLYLNYEIDRGKPRGKKSK